MCVCLNTRFQIDEDKKPSSSIWQHVCCCWHFVCIFLIRGVLGPSLPPYIWVKNLCPTLNCYLFVRYSETQLHALSQLIWGERWGPRGLTCRPLAITSCHLSVPISATDTPLLLTPDNLSLDRASHQRLPAVRGLGAQHGDMWHHQRDRGGVGSPHT